jgi:hypothetical protein
MTKYKMVAISCKAKDLLDEIMKLNPMLKKGAFVEDLIMQEYEFIKKQQEANRR